MEQEQENWHHPLSMDDAIGFPLLLSTVYLRQAVEVPVHVLKVPKRFGEYLLGRDGELSSVELVPDGLRAKTEVVRKLLEREHAFGEIGFPRLYVGLCFFHRKTYVPGILCKSSHRPARGQDAAVWGLSLILAKKRTQILVCGSGPGEPRGASINLDRFHDGEQACRLLSFSFHSA